MGQQCSAECCACDNEADRTYVEQKPQRCDPGDSGRFEEAVVRIDKNVYQTWIVQPQACLHQNQDVSVGQASESGVSEALEHKPAFFPLPPVSPGQASESRVSEASEIWSEHESLQERLLSREDIVRSSDQKIAREDKKRSLKVMVDQFVSSASSGLPCSICYAVHGNSTFRSKATLLLDEKVNVVTFECSKTNIFKVPLATVHVLDFARLQQLRPEDVVVKALEPEEQKLGVLLVRQQGTVCVIADDEAMKVTIQKSLGVLSTHARAIEAQSLAGG